MRSAMVDQLPSFSVTSSALPKYAVPPLGPAPPCPWVPPAGCTRDRSCNGTNECACVAVVNLRASPPC